MNGRRTVGRSQEVGGRGRRSALPFFPSIGASSSLTHLSFSRLMFAAAKALLLYPTVGAPSSRAKKSFFVLQRRENSWEISTRAERWIKCDRGNHPSTETSEATVEEKLEINSIFHLKRTR